MKPVSPILLAIVGTTLLSLTVAPHAYAQSGTGTVQILHPDGASPCVGTSWLTGSPTSPPTGAWLGSTGRLAGASVNASSGPSNAGWGGSCNAQISNSSGSSVTFTSYPTVTYQATAARTTGSGYHTYGQASIYVLDWQNDTSSAEVGDGINVPSGALIEHDLTVVTLGNGDAYNESGAWNVYADLWYH